MKYFFAAVNAKYYIDVGRGLIEGSLEPVPQFGGEDQIDSPEKAFGDGREYKNLVNRGVCRMFCKLNFVVQLCLVWLMMCIRSGKAVKMSIVKGRTSQEDSTPGSSTRGRA